MFARGWLVGRIVRPHSAYLYLITARLAWRLAVGAHFVRRLVRRWVPVLPIAGEKLKIREKLTTYSDTFLQYPRPGLVHAICLNCLVPQALFALASALPTPFPPPPPPLLPPSPNGRRGVVVAVQSL